MSQETTTINLAPKDYATDQEVKWCPGCGDYSVLMQAKKVLSAMGVPKEQLVFVSGIGCSSRFPYYMDTYGFHSIHGRALGIASGVKIANPDLHVWVATGDGDCLSIGGNHLLHTIRRNLDITVLMFNNRIYGLTKGQYSPTTPKGKKTRSSPMGAIDFPLHPLSVAIGAEASFVARALAVNVKHLGYVMERAAKHKGTSFIEIYQNCNIFNDGAFEYASARDSKDDTTIYLEHNKPMVFGKNRDKGIRLNGMTPEVVKLGDGITEDDLLFHNETAADPSLAYLLSRMHHPEAPEPMGVFRAVERPTYEELLMDQIAEATQAKGEGTLESLFDDGEAWEVN